MPMAATISRSAASGLLIVATPVSPQYSCDSTAAVHLAQGDRSARRCASARPAQQDRPSRANASRKASRQHTLRRRNLLKSGSPMDKGTAQLEQRSEEHTSELQSIMRTSYAA